MKIKRIFEISALILFLSAGVMIYAHVYDVDPVSPEKEYLLERHNFERTNDNWNAEFPSFGDWLAERDKAGDKAAEWLDKLITDLGLEFAASFDPAVAQKLDNREGQAAAAPENAMKGERD